MKFGQLVEYNMRNIFLEKSCIKYGGRTSPRPFHKKSELSISLDQHSDVLNSLFLLYVQVEGYLNILKLRCITLDIKLFQKTKRGLELVLEPYFLHDFQRKTDQISSLCVL